MLDGAETVMANGAGTIGALVDDATAVGMTTLLVVRDDAAGTVLELLRDCCVESVVEGGDSRRLGRVDAWERREQRAAVRV